jgi:hypothetical protein
VLSTLGDLGDDRIGDIGLEVILPREVWNVESARRAYRDLTQLGRNGYQ